MTEEEIRCRRLAGQHLLAPAPARTVVRDLCGVQAQFLQSALHALRIRSGGACGPEGLVKSWTIRGTLHVFALEDLPVFLHRGRAQSPRDCDTLEADARVDAARLVSGYRFASRRTARPMKLTSAASSVSAPYSRP